MHNLGARTVLATLPLYGGGKLGAKCFVSISAGLQVSWSPTGCDGKEALIAMSIVTPVVLTVVAVGSVTWVPVAPTL